MSLDENSGIDIGRRKFLVGMTSLLGAVGAIFAAVPFISAWFPSAKVRAAGAPVEVNIKRLEPGQKMTVEWRGKPVWIIRRTQAELENLKKGEDVLRDPESLVEQQPHYTQNRHRSINPEYLVLVGVCTHLGCSPTYRPGPGTLNDTWPGGFYCPCHGSTFDMAGRVFQGVPAPINMQVPPYHFIAEDKLVIGEDPSRARIAELNSKNNSTL